MLYERDYRQLTAEEREQWERAEAYLRRSTDDGAVSAASLCRYWDMLPAAVPYYRTLFPNHFLNPDLLKDTERLEAVHNRFVGLLDTEACKERQILNFIRDERAWPLIGGILQYGSVPRFRFGHHAAYLFPEFPLGSSYVADYLVCGSGSGGYEFIFVELESPRGAITTRDGEFGEAIRKGIAQVREWRRWLTANFALLQSEFEKHLGPDAAAGLPREFCRLDEFRLYYVVVAGRRSDYIERTYALRRELFRENGITLLHYDNLADQLVALMQIRNY